MKLTFKNFKLSYLLYLLIAIALFGCADNNNGETDQQVDPPKQIISVDQAAILYDTYSARRVPIIESYEKQNYPNDPFQPTRFVMYDLQTIKDYIAYIEQEAKEANVEVKDLLFYMANYPDNSAKNNRQNTLFIVPTTDINGANVGFLTTDGPDDKRVAIPIKDRLPKNDNEGKDSEEGKPQGSAQEAGFIGAFSALNPGDRSLVLNDGTIGPPPSSMGLGN